MVKSFPPGGRVSGINAHADALHGSAYLLKTTCLVETATCRRNWLFMMLLRAHAILSTEKLGMSPLKLIQVLPIVAGGPLTRIQGVSVYMGYADALSPATPFPRLGTFLTAPLSSSFLFVRIGTVERGCLADIGL